MDIMPITITKKEIEELEKESIVQENPIVQNYLNKIKEMYDIEIQMSEEEMRILTERLSSVITKRPISLAKTTNDYLTVRDVAELLGISPQMVRRKCNSEKIKAWRTTGDTGEWRIDINQYLDDPTYSTRLADILKRKETRKDRKQKATKALDDIAQMDGFSEMIQKK